MENSNPFGLKRHGGITTIHRNEVKMKKEILENDYRLQTMILKIGSFEILVVAVYFPNN